MKKILTGFAIAAIGVVAATTAQADGMPRGGSIKDAPAAPTCGTSAYNWNGAFAGIQFGEAASRSTTSIEDVLNIAGTREDSGFTVGGVIGYNWQKCNTVFGIEGEFNWTDLDRSWGINLGGVAPGIGQVFSASTTMDWYAALKLRSGFAFDNLLLYITGGIAFANIEHKGSSNAIGVAPAGLINFSSSDTRWGWVTGVGTEYALTPRITWRSEVTYTRFDDKDFSLNISPLLIGPNGGIKLNAQDDLWLVRTGINFKF